jgi:hypothetical protein
MTMISYIDGITRKRRGVQLGRFRTHDTNDVYAQISYGKVPGQAGTIEQSVRTVTLDSSADGLTAGVTGADPGLVLTNLRNRFTIVNNGAGVISAIPHSGAAGTNYVTGDLVYVTQSGAVAGTLRVTAAGGVVTSLALVYRGTGYTTATDLSTTTNSSAGSGLAVDIIAGPDSCQLPASLTGATVTVRNDSPSTGVVKIIPHSGAAGTGYAVGDTISWTQTGGSGGQGVVASIGGSGAVTSIAVVLEGTGYTTASAIATTTSGAGTGLTNALDIYPATGDKINTGAANAAYSLANAKEITFRCYTTGTWIGALSN